MNSPFNSRPHKEVDSGRSVCNSSGISFQFTTSQGGRHSRLNFVFDETNFQFTTSQGGRQSCSAFSGGQWTFNSRPHKEVDVGDFFNNLPGPIFQFTTSQGGRRIRRGAEAKIMTFQFTTSQGGRHKHLKISLKKKLFQFTTSQGGRRLPDNLDPELIPLSIHDLTRRSTGLHGDNLIRLNPFNSRPHKEVDTTYALEFPDGDLSIHDLTRRSTVQKMLEKAGGTLSIHDLTRRSTERHLKRVFF